MKDDIERLLTAAHEAWKSCAAIQDALTALDGQVDERELRAAAQSLRTADSALVTIQQIAGRLDANA
jgi:hypothetical protein